MASIPFHKKRLTVYSTVFEAQIALANKKEQGKWGIARTENGWFIVVRKAKPNPDGSVFNEEQTRTLQQLKRTLPFRIVWGAINPQTQEFEAHATYDRRKLNARLRKGWLVAVAE